MSFYKVGGKFVSRTVKFWFVRSILQLYITIFSFDLYVYFVTQFLCFTLSVKISICKLCNTKLGVINSLARQVNFLAFVFLTRMTCVCGMIWIFHTWENELLDNFEFYFCFPRIALRMAYASIWIYSLNRRGRRKNTQLNAGVKIQNRDINLVCICRDERFVGGGGKRSNWTFNVKNIYQTLS